MKSRKGVSAQAPCGTGDPATTGDPTLLLTSLSFQFYVELATLQDLYAAGHTPGEIRRRWPWLGSHRPGFKRGAWTNRNRMRQGERMRRHMSALSRKEYPMEAAPLQAHEPPKLSPATLTIT